MNRLIELMGITLPTGSQKNFYMGTAIRRNTGTVAVK